jgi:hypothetical protein
MMLTDLLAKHPNIPDVWGEGAIFAFSGLDGESNAASGFVAAYACDPYGLLIHTPARRFLDVALPQEGTPRIAIGDVLAVQTPGGDLLVAYAAWHTLVGLAPQGATLRLRLEEGAEAVWNGEAWLSEDAKAPDALALVEGVGRFALAYGVTAAEAISRARAGLALDAWAEADRRLALYLRLPQLADAKSSRLLKKCFSVMKVNTLGAEGPMRQTWSTPDRVPHKDMWLWDSVFHSLAMNRFDPRTSWHLLKGVLDTQNPDGMIPHQSSVRGWKSQITQPPLLAWGVWENYQALHDRVALEYALPILEGYLNWDLAHRDRNHNHLLEWWIEGNVRSRSGESGLDNSSRFDRAVPLDAVDFSAWAAADMGCLSRIAAELGQQDKAAEWAARAKEMSAQLHKLLWDEAAGFYFDRDMEGIASPVWAATGFMPLLLADLPAGRAERLVGALRDPKRFAAAFPVPTLALTEPAFSTDMWRGPTWLNLNYFIILGLRRQGQVDAARWLAERTLAHVEKYYQRYGVLFEFYDSKDETPPPLCDRKGPHVEPYNIRRKMDSIRDYHWTAAVTALLLQS